MTEAALPQKGSAAIPEAEHKIPPTSHGKIDEALGVLKEVTHRTMEHTGFSLG